MKSDFSTPGFLWPLLTLICLLVILYGLKRGLAKTNWKRSGTQKIFWGMVITVFLWVALLTVLSLKGFFADFSKLPPRPALAILVPLPFVLLFAFSRRGTQLLKSIPPHWLILFQSFRIIVELLIWFAFLANKLPVQMTFEGRNFDVLSGVLALPVAYLIMTRKSLSPKLIVVYNLIGLLLLLNILIVAMLSMPVPFRYFTNEPSAALVAQFPFILLPGVLVPLAYTFHILSLRQLYTRRHDDHIFA